MKSYINDDTIVAISTPIGKSGIGIIRLSGKSAIAIADKIFISSKKKALKQSISHKLHYGWIQDIDEVLLSVMRAPRTYTKEDIVEINCHSGIVILKKILDLVLKCGARLAEPGEFTKRAYLNGRIDLAQAEAVLDMINSKTDKALEVALGQLQGRLSRKVKALRRKILDVLTQLELSIDFSDQDVEQIAQGKLLTRIEDVSCDLRQLIDSADRGAILRQGTTCVISGKPNVGKSSLLNALLKQDRAIVTAFAGTTRDLVEETKDLCGIPLRLIDTAGISRPENLAEKEAIRRSHKATRKAGLVLFVLDGSSDVSSKDIAIARSLLRRPVIIVINKHDLPEKINLNRVKKLLPGKKHVFISALRNQGLEELEKEIGDFIWEGKSSSDGELLITNLRHKQALYQAHQALKRAVKVSKASHGAEIIALEVQEAQESLGEIIGKISSEDVLNRIFSEFCIGK